ncbi:uroporphyrinogen-III synthase [Flavobacterium selenitireducens]|uniref:uroporphyrinogen-III synthase n=1 Tax=Flavobacterium selenitireducens TaxID=2722704 RepID=UPI00168A7992|nr:uroporphyrinogen-III synthase [Flavobacterium selenitireducens]MBD3581652.1 uroporphyrinogen-III synthase [Flavobacterium selenitireducens]
MSTKKLKSGQKQMLADAGLAVIEADFIAIRQKTFALPEIKGNLIFTSQNAVKAVANHPEVQEIRRNPVFCVGEKTAELLDEMGFTVLASADYGSELARIVISDYPNEKFTFFCGNIRRDEMPSELAKSNVDFNEVEVYETVLSPTKIEGKFDGILFLSPSGVESFNSENEFGDAVCFCIGNTTANAVGSSNPSAVPVVANQPTIESTIEKCVNHHFTQAAADSFKRGDKK